MTATCVSRVEAVIAAVLIAAAGVGVRPAAAQSLADVARQEEDRRKTIPAPAKVYTNKDLNQAPGGPVPPAPETNTRTADSTKSADKDADKDKDAKDKASGDDKAPKDEKYWRGRLRTIQEKLARDTTFADAMQSRVTSLMTDILNRTDPTQRAVLERSRVTAVAELARLNKDLADDRKAIADLEEEARRSGVPPGWLR